MANIENVLTAMSLFVDSKGYAGQVEELVPPKLTLKTEEIRAGGMDAPVEIDMGMEKMEASFTLNGYSPDVLKLFGLAPGRRKALTMTGSLISASGEEKSIRVNLQGMLRETDPGTWKPGEKSTLKVTVALSYYKLSINGEVIHEIDPVNMIRKIDGVDQLAQTRINLGL
ncbi:MAG: phage major tail tube protein [Candidatus Sedimenticola sp. 6PFRAG7]